MLLLLPLNGYAQQTVRGDVNGNGVVDIDDVNAVINIMVHKADPTAAADVNGDGAVDIDDLNIIINIMLGKIPDNTPETKTYTVNGVSFKMVAVEGGTFTMGASDDDNEAGYYEKPAHQVTLSSYSIGETEVTQALWVAVMGSNPSWFNGYQSSDDFDYGTNLQHPVEYVSWNDCQEFIAKLNQLTGATFRLPTEAEWEFAARGGNKSKSYKYSGSNTLDDVAWYYDNSAALGRGNPNYGPHTVATKSPNELGLYDMSGNVYEWCQDFFGKYSSGAQVNPTGPANDSSSSHVLRGSSFIGNTSNCRVSYRFSMEPWYLSGNFGLRLALE